MLHQNFFAATALILSITTATCWSQKEAHVVIDASTGHVLSALRSDAKQQIGSLTKIATAVVVLDWSKKNKADLNQTVVIPPEATTVQGLNAVGFQPGDAVSLRDLLFAAMVQSDNIAAYSLAAHVGRSLSSDDEPVVAFVAQMNALARRLGMKNTLFLNPHGVDGAERKQPYSSAHDVALLCRHAVPRADFMFLVSQKERRISINRGGSQVGYALRNTNELLDIEKIDGIKTGTTRRAGECLAITAARPPESREENGRFHITPRRLIVVVLGSNQRFVAARQLLNSGWQQYDTWAAAGRPRSQ